LSQEINIKPKMAAENRFFIALYFRVIEPIMMPNTLDFLGLEVKQLDVEGLPEL